ncbi:MAG: alpha-mannosidase [Planctomycetota bacterium]
MKSKLDFRLDKLRHYMGLIGGRIVRETIGPKELYLCQPAEPTHHPPLDAADWAPYGIGEPWGEKNGWAAFRAVFCVPEPWAEAPVELRMSHHVRWLEPPVADDTPAGPEGQVFVNGDRAGAIDGRHESIRWDFPAGHPADVRAVFFAGRCACRHELETLELALVDPETERLYHDLRVALELVEQTEEAAAARYRIIDAAEAAVETLERGDVEGEGFYERVAPAQEALSGKLGELRGAGDAPEVACMGHAHIDLGWLWPIRQTRHKCTRTFGTQCRLLEQYGHWSFLQSQAQAYAWVEQDAPELFRRIRELVEAGRWQAQGATWCEMDTNIPSGESLVRQLLYGKRYFRRKFGVDCAVLWLPDVFGYSAALPQILKLAGVEGFVTSKISWNQVNRFPHDTFRWRGLDGTELPTHFITAPCGQWFYTYNGRMSVEELKGTWDEYRQKEAGTEPLLTFGWGDGGGGPTEQMLETADRLAEWPAVEGVPRVRFETAEELMERIAARSDALPVWDGELYLEYHRGTYTTQAWLKRANRKNEVRLHNVEWLAALAEGLGFELDKPALDALWQDLLLCQFHDILPGSSVGELYEEVRDLQDEIAHQADEMIGEASRAVARQVDTSAYLDPVVLLNTLSWDRNDPVELPDGTWRDDAVVPAGGWAAIDAEERIEREEEECLAVSSDLRHLSNRFWDLKLDEEGRIVQLHDRRRDRPVLAEDGLGNEWQVFADRPAECDAWNIPPYYESHRLADPTCLGMRILDQNEVRVAVEVTWDLPQEGNIVQNIALYANHPRIDFETRVEWHTTHQLLKVAFPVNVRAREATYQVQFGHLSRPTHRNTSWDWARYEGCAHGFVDLAEHGYGVALINDCKYGYDVRENVIRLTCLRSPTSPHREADQGLHEFSYSLLPHAGTFQEAGVIRAAAELNNPLIPVPVRPTEGTLPASEWFIACDEEAVVLNTVKPAEEAEGMILRLYESHGSHCAPTLTFPEPVEAVRVVDLLEEPMEADVGLEHEGNAVSFRLRPFQILSLHVHR